MPKDHILLAHTADWHLRSRQFGVTSRGEDFYDAVIRYIEHFAEATPRVDAIINVGDIFDESRPPAKVINQLMMIDAMLKSYGIPMISVTGNHDWSNPTWLSSLFPRPRLDKGGVYPLDDKSVDLHGFTIVGVKQMSVSTYRGKEEAVLAQCKGADVVLFHALVNGVVASSIPAENMIDIDDLPYRVAGLKFIALGDVHVTGYVEHGGVLVGYPGSLEMGSRSEPVIKRAPVIKVTKDKATVVSMEAMTIRPFVAKNVYSQEDLDALIAELTPITDKHPVVTVVFDRDLPETITRVYGLLDAGRAVIRLSPAPRKEAAAEKQYPTRDEMTNEKTMEYFVRQKFTGSELVDIAALDLLQTSPEVMRLFDTPRVADVRYLLDRLAQLNVRE